MYETDENAKTALENGSVKQLDTTTAPAAAQETEGMTALQKFMAALVGADKKAEPAAQEKPEEKETAPSGKSFSENDFKSALEAERQKWELEQAEKERLAKLPPADREKTERDLQDKKISELETKLQTRNLKDIALAELSKEGFPLSLANALNYADEKTMRATLEVLKVDFKTCLADALKEKIKGKTPLGLGGTGTENSIKEQIARNIRGGLR